mgnify:CR=1 FL=1
MADDGLEQPCGAFRHNCPLIHRSALRGQVVPFGEAARKRTRPHPFGNRKYLMKKGKMRLVHTGRRPLPSYYYL